MSIHQYNECYCRKTRGPLSVDHKRKLSLANKGWIYPSDKYPNRGTRGKKFPVDEYPNHGMRNKHHSELTRKKISLKSKGLTYPIDKYPNYGNRGKKFPVDKYPNYGTRGKKFPKELYPNRCMRNKHHTIETRKKMCKPKSLEHRKHISEGQKGTHRTEETKIKISIGNTGKTRSNEVKKRMSLTRKEKGLAIKNLRNMRKNQPYWWMGVSFDSNEERQLAIWQLLNWGVIPEEGVNCHIQVNGGELDFRPFDWLFMEYHPWDRLGRSKEEYYQERRALLDKNGYKNCKLIIITLLDEWTQ